MSLHVVPSVLLTKTELAGACKCSVSTIDRMRKDGLPSVTVGRRLVRFDESAIAWVREHQG